MERLPPLLVVGAGNMGRAIVLGAAAGGAIEPRRIVVVEPSPDARRELLRRAHEMGVAGSQAFDAVGPALSVFEPFEASAGAGVVVLCVKPQKLAEAAADLRDALTRRERLVISILAGTPTGKLAAALGPAARVVRAMPNVALAIGRGCTALCTGPRATPNDLSTARSLFATGGQKVVDIEERLMDAFTAIVGSGPAYLFYLAEAMQAAAARLGFAEPTSAVFVRATLLGAAELLAGSPRSPSDLRASVTSPAGTTAAAIDVLEHASVRDALVRAVVAARDRGAELSSA